MIVILKQNTKKEDLDRFISMLNSYHVKIADISGEQHSIFGLIGDTSKIDIDLLRARLWLQTSSVSRSRTKAATESSTRRIPSWTLPARRSAASIFR